MLHVIAALVGAVAGSLATFALTRARSGAFLRAERERAEAQLALERAEVEKRARDDAEREVGRREEAARRGLERDRESLDADRQRLLERERELGERERAAAERTGRLEARAATIEREEAGLADRERWLAERERTLAEAEHALELAREQVDERLAEVADLPRDRARAELLERLDRELAEEQSRRILAHEQDLRARAKEVAIEIVGRAIQRYAAEHTADSTTAKVTLAEEDLKGRIIGKEGRNIRAFELATGVDLIVDDTPGVITVSCFDGVRREIARRALEELLEDRRIHPGRIEEIVARIQQDLDRETFRRGEDAALHCEVSGLHPQLVQLLGKLHYRTSYGQNVLVHTQEVAFLCGAMAADLGLDPKLARRCGLLHDIGKALDHEHEGSHPELGHAILKRYGENETVANAALAHHEGHEVLSPYTTFAAAADAISAARPGARRENAERYLKRLQQLEDIACTFKGVHKAYAIQAGRELRVFVDGGRIDDKVLPKVARDIARRIEGEVAYPGEVKVTLIRETRHSATAR